MTPKSEGDYYFDAVLTDEDNSEVAKYTIKLSTSSVEDIYVEPISLNDDFIKGVDISSLESELESGAKYYDYDGNELDEQGFFNFLAENGTNWVRIRVWNDPKDSNGNTYGGGDCTLERAISMGKYATNAGLKVLIDFHYSDTWADPKRQLTPKAWQGLSVDEKIQKIGEYTETSVNKLLDAGVDVQMVQVGNETTNKICDISESEGVSDGSAEKYEKMCEAFNSRAKGVRAAADSHNKNIKVAIHIESPQSEGKYASYAKALDKFGVDYDVFASSYYPMWHGTLENLNNVLSDIADKYDKEVLVAETSWSFDLGDGDGWGNEVSAESGYDNYEFSVQGQVNQLTDVIKTMADTKNGLGVFYWEPAWIPVNNIYDDGGNYLENAKQENVLAWEKYGSGWATKACSEYDPNQVGANGEWAGGSAVDNHAWFDYNGYPLASLKTYGLLETGSTTLAKKVYQLKADDVKAYVGDKITTPSVTVRYNYGENDTITNPDWDTKAIEEAVKKGAGEYKITGTVDINGKSYDVSFNLKIEEYNYLADKNYSFENKDDGKWKINCDNKQIVIKNDSSNAYEGTYTLKYDGQINEGGAYQTVTLDKGVYKLGAFLEGRTFVEGESYELYVTVDGKTYSASAKTADWANWQNPEVADIEITKDNTTVEVGCKMTTTAGAWGAWDNFYLIKTGEIEETKPEQKSQTITVKAAKNDKITKTYGDKKFNLNAKAKTTLSYTSSNKAVAKNDSKGNIAIKGAGKTTITIKAKSTSTYKSATKKITLTVKKAKQTLKVSKDKLYVKSKDIKKAGKTFKIKTSSKNSVSFKLKSGSSKYVSVSKNGVITVKKNAKKGTYIVYATAKSSTNYESAAKAIKVVVK